MLRSAWLPSAGVALALVGLTGRLEGRDLAKFPRGATETPAYRYAHLGADNCRAELGRRGIAFREVEEARGVLAPVRLTGALGGVVYRTDFPAAKRPSLPWEIFDCRLVLAMHDFSSILAAHDVEEVRIFSGYRPPSKRWPKDKLARRHPGALALDVRMFRKRDGTVLVVEEHFNGRIGSKTCGESAAKPQPPALEARELRSIACEAADAQIFNSILTPNYDRPHRNHFHLEVTPGVKWFIVR
jgi:hypothetical protein